MYLRRILAIILATALLLFVSGMIYLGAALLTDKSADFERRLQLPGQHSLAIVKRPPCTWDRPSIVACYQGGVHTYPEARLIYCTQGMCQVLVSFVLPEG